jgi:hypothetical protein
VHVAFEQGGGGEDLQIAPAAVKAGGNDDLMLVRGKPRYQVTADETGAADDKDTHVAAPVRQDSAPILPCTGDNRKRASAARLRGRRKARQAASNLA